MASKGYTPEEDDDVVGFLQLEEELGEEFGKVEFADPVSDGSGMFAENGKVVVLGEPGVGKTTLIATCRGGREWSYLQDPHPEESSIVFPGWSFPGDKRVQPYAMRMWDAPQDLSQHGDADVVLLLASLGDLTSFENANEKWFPLIKQHMPEALVFLLGTKPDLLDIKQIKKADPAFKAKKDLMQRRCKEEKVTYCRCAPREELSASYVLRNVIREKMRRKPSPSDPRPLPAHEESWRSRERLGEGDYGMCTIS